jgi:tetratricopeptide (TPR) repeat protein
MLMTYDCRRLWLVMLLMLAGVSACTPIGVISGDDSVASAPSAPVPSSVENTSAALPVWRDSLLAQLDQGQHHPAVLALLQKAEQARRQNNWSAAMTWLDQARQIQPRNAEILYRQAWVLSHTGRYEEGEQWLQRGLMFSLDNRLSARMQLLRAECLQHLGRTNEAQTARRQAARLDPALLSG